MLDVGVPDSTRARVITFASEFETAGVHTGTKIVSTQDLGHISDVQPKVDLIDGSIYTFSLEYEDSVGNPKAVVKSHLRHVC